MATDTDLPTDSTPTDAPHADAPHVGDAETTDREQVLLARVEEYDDGPDECTIYPANATAAELPTTWLSAEEGAFVSLEEMH
ncbi:DUF7511 domain-containing protein [Halobellus limi]|uniref:DUF7511 domain-containing protein n=1 Tax=Halobellus limi TaxID=699433 RepID=A0A1H5VZV8_9EURY|nr:hypothetical protein [Halobellus limi]QCC48828.1 hypothetical protein DV707_02175 [Halobellus limi]SEF92568.1 hypothetical protein SAMN04488133_1121 [Halobellus limi]